MRGQDLDNLPTHASPPTPFPHIHLGLWPYQNNADIPKISSRLTEMGSKQAEMHNAVIRS